MRSRQSGKSVLLFGHGPRTLNPRLLWITTLPSGRAWLVLVLPPTFARLCLAPPATRRFIGLRTHDAVKNDHVGLP